MKICQEKEDKILETLELYRELERNSNLNSFVKYLKNENIKLEHRIMAVTVVQHDISIPTTKYAFAVPLAGEVADLRKEIARVTKIKASNVVIADVFHHKIYKFFADSDSISNIKEFDVICAYELPNLAEDAHTSTSDIHYIPVKFCCAKTNGRGQSKMVARGIPFALPFNSKTTTTKDLYDSSLEFVKRYLKDGISEIFNLSKPETLFPQKSQGEEQKKFLFSLGQDSYNGSHQEILYSDDLYLGSMSMFSSTPEKRLQLVIDSDTLEDVIDEEKFRRVVDHVSLKITI